jgi:hypothetical protein
MTAQSLVQPLQHIAIEELIMVTCAAAAAAAMPLALR